MEALRDRPPVYHETLCCFLLTKSSTRRIILIVSIVFDSGDIIPCVFYHCSQATLTFFDAALSVLCSLFSHKEMAPWRTKGGKVQATSSTFGDIDRASVEYKSEPLRKPENFPPGVRSNQEVNQTVASTLQSTFYSKLTLVVCD